MLPPRGGWLSPGPEGWEGGDGDRAEYSGVDDKVNGRRKEAECLGDRRQTNGLLGGGPLRSYFPDQGEELGLGSQRAGNMLCATGQAAALSGPWGDTRT